MNTILLFEVPFAIILPELATFMYAPLFFNFMTTPGSIVSTELMSTLPGTTYTLPAVHVVGVLITALISK